VNEYANRRRLKVSIGSHDDQLAALLLLPETSAPTPFLLGASRLNHVRLNTRKTDRFSCKHHPADIITTVSQARSALFLTA